MSAHEENEKGEKVNCLANKCTLAGAAYSIWFSGILGRGVANEEK